MKPGVYTQLYVQLVFAVRNRDAVLHPAIRERIFKYMSGILTEMKHKSIIINGVSDHVHILFELHPTSCLSDIMRDVKSNSSKWINENKFIVGKFSWQEGYGGFSYSHTQRDNVINYILDQEKHHSMHSFKDEYMELLRIFQIEFKDEYVFEFYE